jgi:hypothetical protein
MEKQAMVVIKNDKKPNNLFYTQAFETSELQKTETILERLKGKGLYIIKEGYHTQLWSEGEILTNNL